MEVDVISREMIKPSSPTPLPLKTFKLSFLDQLIPPFYTPLILFYPAIGNNKVEINSILSVLKASLSKALTHCYPLAGRISDHFSISCNDEGAFYCETRIHSRIHEFLESPNLESLNQLLPFRPFVKQLYPSVPQVAVQANIFECRGLAIGICMLHKIIDAVTMSNFLTTWATIARGCAKEFHTDFHTGSSLFPPRDQLPDEYSSAMDKGWFMEGRYVTRRFVFDPKGIDILKDTARSENVPNPTRYEALSSFIWKHATAAARATSKSPKLSVSIHSVDMRSRMEEPLSRNTIGNLLWSATSGFDSAKTDIVLSDLVTLTRESIRKINGDYLKTLQGDQGCSVIDNGIKLMLENFSLESPDSFGFSSWCNLGYRETDFGWGKPVWVGIWGGEASPFRNLVIFLETRCGLGIEAWMTLDEHILSALEGDNEFLAFASPNQSIPSV